MPIAGAPVGARVIADVGMLAGFSSSENSTSTSSARKTLVALGTGTRPVIAGGVRSTVTVTVFDLSGTPSTVPEAVI